MTKPIDPLEGTLEEVSYGLETLGTTYQRFWHIDFPKVGAGE